MRHLGVQNLVAFCLNDACRHSALIDVSGCPTEAAAIFECSLDTPHWYGLSLYPTIDLQTAVGGQSVICLLGGRNHRPGRHDNQ